MPSLGGLDCDIGGFQITNLADHNNVRVLSKKSAQRGGKVQMGFFVDIDLVDSGQVDFNGIFDTTDIDRGGVQSGQSRVQ